MHWCRLLTHVSAPNATPFVSHISVAGIPSSHCGPFISLDGRPLTSVRGLMRDIIKQYRSHFRSVYQVKQNSTCSPDPFLYLRIKCEPGSYDVNIEPAKDEVLFTDTDVVKDCFTRLLIEAYGEIEHPPSRGNRIVNAATRPEANRPFDILLARRQPILDERSIQDDTIGMYSSGQKSVEQDVESQRDPQIVPPFIPCEDQQEAVLDNKEDAIPSSTARKVFQTMYSVDEEELDEEPSLREATDEVEPFAEDEVESRKATNPWAIAKMNAPVTRKHIQSRDPEPSTNSSPSMRLYTPAVLPLLNGPQLLPTPETSPRSPPPYQNPGPPLRRRARIVEESPSPITDTDRSRASSESSHVRTLDKWFQNAVGNRVSPTAKFPPTDASQVSSSSSPSSRQSLSPGRGFGSPDTVYYPPFANARTPFKSPLRSTSPFRQAQPSVRSQGVEDDFENAELEEIMVFERRKKAINKQQRHAQSKLGNALADPARLAKLQQKALRQSANYEDLDEHRSSFTQSSQQSVLYAERFGEDATQTTDHFRSSQSNQPPSQTQAATPTQSPRLNRGLAMRRDPASSYPPSQTAPVPLPDDPVTLDRPRRRRASSRNQPLERTPPALRTHNLTQTVPFSGTSFNSNDIYTSTCGTSPGFVTWSAFNMSSSQLAFWQSTVEALVLKHYRAGVGDDPEGTTLTGFEVGLSQAIKAHVEMLAGL